MQPTTVDNTMTSIVLVVIAIAAMLTIVAILVGVRKRNARREADAAENARLAERPATHRPLNDGDATDVPPASAPARPAATPAAPIASPATPVPVAPPPPPLTDMPEVAPAAPLADAPAPLTDEPVAAAAPLQASPAAEAQPMPASPAGAAAEPAPEQTPEPAPAPTVVPAAPAGPAPGQAPVTQIKGLGPKVAAMLAEMGIVTVGELAALDQRAAEDLDARLGPFTGRMGRDRWLEQAKLLAAGDIKGFEERFGKL